MEGGEQVTSTSGVGEIAPIAPERLETARIFGERFIPAHEDEFIELQLNPQVARTMMAPQEPRTREAARAAFERKLRHWRRYGFGQWLFRDRASGTTIGRGGPQHTPVSGRDEVEIGWAIVPERWGEGLATELAWASLEVVFGPLALEDVIAYTQVDNLASRRVMEKTGFVYERDITVQGRPFVLYRRHR
jgi:ribosomal-protein-alanine N-acetyltransferase